MQPGTAKAIGKQRARAIARILEVVEETDVSDDDLERIRAVTRAAVCNMERRVLVIVDAALENMTVNEMLLDQEAARG